MKLRLMICAMAASAALFAADDYTGTQPIFGVLGVTDNVTSNTVVGVPWVSATGGQISLSNLVSTATLEAGDIVYLYEGTTWYGYRLTGGVWEPMTTVGTNSVTSAGSADEKKLACGTGLIVQRATNANPIYLCGRDKTATVTTSISANSINLIANPTTAGIEMSSGNAGDQIRVPLNGGAMTIYEMHDGQWATYAVTGTVTRAGRTTKLRGWVNGCTLPAGKGAWYVSGDTGREINW